MIITRPQSDLSGKQAVAFGFHSQAMLSGFSLWQASELTNNVGKGEGFGERGGALSFDLACTSPARLSRVSHVSLTVTSPLVQLVQTQGPARRLPFPRAKDPPAKRDRWFWGRGQEDKREKKQVT